MVGTKGAVRLYPHVDMELLPKILLQQLLKSVCMISLLLWLLGGMALGAFCEPSHATALDLQQFHPFGKCQPRSDLEFLLEWELF